MTTRRTILLSVSATALAVVGCSRPLSRDDRISAAPRPDTPASLTESPSDAPRSLTQAGEIIGMSVEGRPIEAVTLGGAGRRVLLVGGIHGDEPEGGRTVEAVIMFLRRLAPDARVRVVRDVNPDGTASGSRSNARGVDLNRNWPAGNFRPGGSRGPAPLSEPETKALHDELERFGPDLVVVCHSARGGPFVNFDGPAASEAVAFAAAAARSDNRWHVRPDMGYPTPGSLGTYLGVDRGVPILTIEFARGHEPGSAWAAMRDGIAAVLGHTELSK